MTLCITGVAGFIGSNLAEMAIAAGHPVVGIDCFLGDSYDSEIKKRNLSSIRNNNLFEFHEVDMSDRVFPEIIKSCTQIVHLAAMPGLMKSWENPNLYVKHNILSTINLIESASKDLETFILGSTSSVYGSFAKGGTSAPLLPISPYGATKLSAEVIAQSYMRSTGLPLQILRFFSVYGPRQRPDMAYDIFIRHILQSKPITVYGDGEQTRSNTYVSDVCTAVMNSIRFGLSGNIINISGLEKISINHAIERIESHVGKKAELTFERNRIGDQRETIGIDIEAWAGIDYSPRVKFEDGIKNQIDHIMNENFQ